MSPMGLLSYPVVLVISLAAIVASAAAFVYLVLRERIRLPKPLMFAVAGVATAFAFTLEPFRQTLSFGQINIYLALLVLTGWAAIHADAPIEATTTMPCCTA